MISCVFVQNDSFVNPFIYNLNRVKFVDYSILNITVNYDKQKNIKEIGIIPFYAPELEFIERYKDDQDIIIPHIQLRSQSINELFNINEPISVYILSLQEILNDMEKKHFVFKQPEYLFYFKYLFLYKYFPYSQESSLVIDKQYQLKFNDIQQ